VSISCTDTAGRPEGVAVARIEPGDVRFRDTAAGTIVENLGAAWVNDSERWTVDDTAFLTIGAGRDPSDYLVDLRDAVRLSDGDIVAIDWGIRESMVTRFSGATGERKQTISRRGQGPGEFIYSPSLVLLPGDTLAINTGVALALFSSDGALRRELLRDRTGQAPGMSGKPTADVIGRFDATRLAVVARETMIATPAARAAASRGRPVGPCEPDRSLHALDDRERLGDTIAVLYRRGEGPGPPSRLVTLVTNDVDLIVGIIAVHGARVYAGCGAEPGFRVYDSRGLIMRVTAPLPSRAIDGAEAQRYFAAKRRHDSVLKHIAIETREIRISGSASSRESRRNAILADTAMPLLPDSTPYFTAMVVDKPGNVWLRRYVAPYVAITHGPWAVFDTSGRLLGEVRLRDDMQVFEIGDDYVLGRRWTADWTPLIVLHRLRKPGQ
jgi:hypothetical protein